MTRYSTAKKIRCPSCGGDLVESEKIERQKGVEKKIPVGQCLNCSTRYDRHTPEYYKLFQEVYLLGADDMLLSLGLKGELGEEGCEINGHQRLQPEEIDKPAVVDDWQIFTESGSYLWITVEEGRLFFCSLYEPVSFTMDADSHHFEFEGRYVHKRCARRYRVVSTDGYLRQGVGIGDQVTVYRFMVNGVHFELLTLAGKNFFRKCERISRSDALFLFRNDDYGDIIDNHFLMTKKRRFRCLWYFFMFLCCLIYISWTASRQNRILSSSKPALVLESGARFLSEGVYSSQYLYGPVVLDGTGMLYRVSVRNTEEKISPCDDWTSLGLMLVRQEKLGQIPKSSNVYRVAKLRETFNAIDVLKHPLEDFSFRAYLWQISGQNHKGMFRRRKDEAGTDFVLEEKGTYYIYLESYGARATLRNSFKVCIDKKAGDTRFPAAAGLLFFLLALYNYKRSVAGEDVQFPIVQAPED